MTQAISGLVGVLLLLGSLVATAAEPWQPIPRSLPPRGIEISAEDRARLKAELARVEKLRDNLLKSRLTAEVSTLLPDAQIYFKAVRFALDENEFFRQQDVAAAFELLKMAEGRIDELSQGRHDWTDVHGL